MHLSNEEDDVGSNPAEGVSGWGMVRSERLIIPLNFTPQFYLTLHLLLSILLLVGKVRYATRKGVVYRRLFCLTASVPKGD